MTTIGFSKKFDKDVSFLIAQFATPIPKKFVDWVPIDRLGLRNNQPIHFNLQNLDFEHHRLWNMIALLISWVDDSILFDLDHKITHWELQELFTNKNAFYFIEHKINQLLKNNQLHLMKTSRHISLLCGNPIAIPILEKLTNNFTTCLDEISWPNLSHNINAVHVLGKKIKQSNQKWNQLLYQNNQKRIDHDHNVVCWELVCDNPNAVPLIEKYINKNCALCRQPLTSKSQSNFFCSHFNWTGLCNNPNAVHLLQKRFKQNQNPRELFWNSLSDNSNAIPLLRELTNNFTTNLDKICWDRFCLNPNAIPVLIEHFNNLQHRIIFSSVCINSNAVPLLSHVTNGFTTNLSVLDWMSLCKNPNTVFLIEKLLANELECLPGAQDQIDWEWLSVNPSALNLLKQNQHKIVWYMFFQNPSIIETDKDIYRLWLNYITNYVYKL